MRDFLRPVLLALVFSFAAPALADSPAGNAVDVVQQANGDLGGTVALLSTGDGVYMGQRVVTGGAGRVQVVFNDDTHLVIGPGSTLVIDKYLMRNDGSASKFVIDAVGGTFRFITGNSPKNAYQITTPTGTLGVRGTAFDFGVDKKTGETQVLLYHGGVNMCGEDGTCVLLSETCAVGLIPQHEQAHVFGHNDRRRPPVLKNFPYLNSQSPLQADFRVGGTGSCRQLQPEVTEPTKVVFHFPAPRLAPQTPSVPVTTPVVTPPDEPDCSPGDKHQHRNKCWVHDGNLDHDQGWGNNDSGPSLQTEQASLSPQTFSVASTSGAGTGNNNGSGNGGGDGGGNDRGGNDGGHGNNGRGNGGDTHQNNGRH